MTVPLFPSVVVIKTLQLKSKSDLSSSCYRLREVSLEAQGRNLEAGTESKPQRNAPCWLPAPWLTQLALVLYHGGPLTQG